MLSAAKKLIAYLRRAKTLAVQCPSCERLIAAEKADLFTEDCLSPRAKKYMQLMEEEIGELRADIHDLEYAKPSRVQRVTHSVNVGKIFEKLTPILRGFDCHPFDCRALFEPIDLIVFHGLRKNRISHIEMLDIKSGKARLNPIQRDVSSAIKSGRVGFEVLELDPK